MNIRRILCVHHGPGMGRLRQALESEGYEVVPASNGGKALDVLSSQDVDGVVLDFDAEAPGGFSLRTRIHHQRPDIPMLLFDDVNDIEHLPLHVFRAYLQHPGPPDAILAHLKN
ncbi:MAG: response regulator [Terriglobales bacterium]